MMRSGSNKVIDAIFESRILEAKQGIIVISFKARGIKYGMQVVNTSGLNKLKKMPGFTEIDSYVIPENDSPKRFYAEIEDDIKTYGIDPDNFSPESNGTVLGKKDTVGYGYTVNDSAKVKIHKFGVSN